MSKLNVLVILFLIGVLFVPTKTALARIGVGIGTGKIQIDEKLKPGIIYELPPLNVLNTGDEVSDYEVAVAYHEKQSQLMPPEAWFIFEPQRFSLEPNAGSTVTVKLNLPLKTIPGDYFAYLEAHPTKKAENGNTSIGVAAAAKLYFTVEPANIIEGMYYRAISYWKIYQPWSSRFAVLAGIVLALILFKKFFNIQINIKKPEKKTDSQE
ncbi:hypothetical protein HYV31_03600 [candidate division WWE3 bacterium]|nr:hypothetical protein [candidate division WWE3 bacterium]